jgi:hypothetical protein
MLGTNLMLLSLIASNFNSNFTNVIEQILESAEHKIRAHSLTIIDATADANADEFINELIVRVKENRKFCKTNLEHVSKLARRRFYFNIIVIDSMEDFKRLMSNFTHYRIESTANFIILFERAKLSDVQEIFQFLWDFYVHNVITIRSNDSSISIDTFMPFTESACNKTSPIEIGKYRHGKFILRPADFFPEKFQNFHGCPLKVTTFESLAPSVLRIDYPNGTYHLHGRDVDVFKTLAETFNFKLNVTYLQEYGGWGYLYPNGSATGSMGRAIRRETDFSIGNLLLIYERSIYMSHSVGYFLETLIFMIPPGKELSSLVKLIRPFGFVVWIVLFITLILCLVIIALLELMPRKIREFVYGTGVNTPFLNILSGIFGLSQHKVPQRNFARTLLMIFVLFCLVIRTLYQGSLFKFLQVDDRVPEPKTIEEMSERNLKFFVIKTWNDFTKNNSVLPKGVMKKTLNEDFDGGLLIAFSEVLYRNKLRAFKGLQLYKVCKVIAMNAQHN